MKVKAKNRRNRGSIKECVDFSLSREGKDTIGKSLYLTLRVLSKVPDHYLNPADIDNIKYLSEIIYQNGFDRGKYDFEFIDKLKIELVPYNDFLKQRLQYKPLK